MPAIRQPVRAQRFHVGIAQTYPWLYPGADMQRMSESRKLATTTCDLGAQFDHEF